MTDPRLHPYIALTGLEGNGPPRTSVMQAFILSHHDVFVGAWSLLYLSVAFAVLTWLLYVARTTRRD